MLFGKQVIEQGRANPAHMEGARGAWCKTYPYLLSWHINPEFDG